MDTLLISIIIVAVIGLAVSALARWRSRNDRGE